MQEVGLAAEEGGNLQHVDILGGHRGLGLAVDVGHHGDIVFLADGAQDLEALAVADAGEGADAGAVGLAVAGFEGEGNLQAVGDGHQAFAHLEGVFVVLYHTRTGNQEEIAGLCVFG